MSEESKLEIKKVPQIKICGITTEQEAYYLNEADVAYAGLVFCKESKRNVTLLQAEKIIKALDSSIRKVAVFLEPDYEILENIHSIGVDGVQIHREFQSDKVDASFFVWKAFSIGESMGENMGGSNADTNVIQSQKDKMLMEKLSINFSDKRIEGILFDAAKAGSGRTFPWSITEQIESIRIENKDKKIILAGGLNEQNVQQGIHIFYPDIVDVSSGVEGKNGLKSKEKIMEFVRKVRNYE